MVFALLLPWSGFSAHFFLHTFAFLTVSMLAVTSHMRTMLTDPGAVPVGYSPEHLLHEERGESLPMCSRCNGFKPPRAHHCSQCNRCVMKMDHHCPWVNNCVGANNQKHFVLFVGYTGLMCSYALLLLCLRTVNAVPAGGGPPTGQIGASAPGPLTATSTTAAHARACARSHAATHAATRARRHRHRRAGYDPNNANTLTLTSTPNCRGLASPCRPLPWRGACRRRQLPSHGAALLRGGTLRPSPWKHLPLPLAPALVPALTLTLARALTHPLTTPTPCASPGALRPVHTGHVHGADLIDTLRSDRR